MERPLPKCPTALATREDQTERSSTVTRTAPERFGTVMGPLTLVTWKATGLPQSRMVLSFKTGRLTYVRMVLSFRRDQTVPMLARSAVSFRPIWFQGLSLVGRVATVQSISTPDSFRAVICPRTSQSESFQKRE